MSALRYVEGDEVQAERLPGSVSLRILLPDQCLLAARIKRAFPLSKPDELLSIQTGDGKEVAVLRSLSGLETNTRRLIEEELDRRYFTPRIDRINALKQEAGMWRFNVQTQRGPAEFYVRNWRDSAAEIAPGRWQINSVDGARFEIPELEALDARSRRFMDLLL